jgi:YVTN family beta-propeller protein
VAVEKLAHFRLFSENPTFSTATPVIENHPQGHYPLPRLSKSKRSLLGVRKAFVAWMIFKKSVSVAFTSARSLTKTFQHPLDLSTVCKVLHILPKGLQHSSAMIDTASNTVTAIVGVGSSPAEVAITPDGAYVTNVLSNSVSVIDTGTNTVVATVRVGIEPVGVAITAGIGPPTNKNQCKNDGCKVFTIPEKFKNQGDCVSFVNAGK